MSTADGSSEALVAALSASLRKVSAERERLEGKLTAAQGSLQQSRRSYAALVREIRAQQDAILLTQHATREVGEEKRSIELQLSKVSDVGGHARRPHFSAATQPLSRKLAPKHNLVLA